MSIHDEIQLNQLKEIVFSHLLYDMPNYKEGMAYKEVPTDKPMTELGADSLGGIEIVMIIEDRLGVMIPDEISGRDFTINNILEFLANE